MKKSKELFVNAVIVAAGRGTRMCMDKNKQYIDIAGKPILARTLEAFDRCDLINEIIVVVSEQDIVYCKQHIIDMYGIKKVKCIVAGGDERQESVYNGLLNVSSGCDIVVIHDGARPFITEDIIINSILTAKEYGAACVAVPTKDTIKVSDSDQFINETLNRSMLWSIQTPQAFAYKTIMEAHIKAKEDGFVGTDDAVLVERLGLKVKLVMGSYDNIKITTKDDLVFAQAIIDNMGN